MLSFFKKIYWIIFSTHQWFILYKDKSSNEWIRLKQPSNVSRADTFIVKENDKYFIFFEEFDIKGRHGYLCVGELDKIKKTLDNVQICLKKDYHLSFPNVFKYLDKYYMIPETHANNSIDLYEFEQFPYKLKKIKTLVCNINAADSVLVQKDNLWFLFTNIYTNVNCLHSENLSIFTSDHLLNKDFKQLHKNPVVADKTYSRMGGQFYSENNKLYRVSQDCKVRYGYKVNIMEVDSLTVNTYNEHLHKEIYPPKGYIAFHTLNSCEDIEVADGKIIVKTPKVVLDNIVILFKIIIKKLIGSVNVK